MQVNQHKVSAAKASTEADQSERALFEGWVRSEWPAAPLQHSRDALPLNHPSYYNYCNEIIQRAWVGWQARAAMARTSAALELERTEVVAFIHERTGAVATADMVRAMEEGSVPSGYTIGLMAVVDLDRIVKALRYKAELYDEVWELVTGKGYMNVTTAISKLEQERDAARDRVAELERKLKGQWTYASDQATHCGGCGKHKHTPLRVDWMGGYVCLTCIDEKLEALYEADQAGQVPEEVRRAAMELVAYSEGSRSHQIVRCTATLRDWLAAVPAQEGE